MESVEWTGPRPRLLSAFASMVSLSDLEIIILLDHPNSRRTTLFAKCRGDSSVNGGIAGGDGTDRQGEVDHRFMSSTTTARSTSGQGLAGARKHALPLVSGGFEFAPTSWGAAHSRKSTRRGLLGAPQARG